MEQVVRARCPRCRKALRIPTGWVGGGLRCKHCGQVFRCRQPPVQVSREGRGKAILTSLGLVALAALFVVLVVIKVHRTPVPVDRPESPADASAAGPGPRETVSEPEIANPARPVQKVQPAEPARPDGPFSRRLLAMAVNNYVFADPVSFGPAGRDVHGLVQLTARVLHVPDSQVVELYERGPKARPPRKQVIEGTVKQFLDGCRAQDRILMLFIGRAVEIDRQAYLVPVEGDLELKDTLIPLAWLNDRLAGCRARQKVLVLDVCRLDPCQGQVRPGGGPMAAGLDAMLQNPPPGVQVWSSCAGGQFSYDLDNGQGGLFLKHCYDALAQLEKGALSRQYPDEPLPVNALAALVQGPTEAETARLYKAKQTPRLTGREAGGAAYNPQEPLPAPVSIPAAIPPAGTAGFKAVQDLLQGFECVPFKVGRDGAGLLRPADLPWFRARDLEPYRLGSGAPAVRDAVEKARGRLSEALTGKKRLRDRFPALANLKQLRQQVLNEQKDAAKLIDRLSEARADLQKLSTEAEKAPKALQANYNYVLARLSAQIAYLYEYDFALGDLRKDLPPRDAKVHQGWQLAAREKVATRDGKPLMAEARKGYQKLIADCPGTPWAVLAKRDLLTRWGVEWQPCRMGRP